MASSDRATSPMVDKKDIRLLIMVLTRLIVQNCPDDSLSGITPRLSESEKKTLSIFTARLGDGAIYKYEAILNYLDALKIPYEKIEDSRRVNVQMADLLKNEMIQKKMDELRESDRLMKESKSIVATESKTEPLSQDDFKKIAGLFNVFFAPFEEAIWTYGVNNNIRAEFDFSRLPNAETLVGQVTEYFAVSPTAEKLGFTQQRLEAVREKLIFEDITDVSDDEDSKEQCVQYSVESVAVLRPYLQVVEKLEELTGKKIQVDSKSLFYVLRETEQIQEMVKELRVKNKDFKTQGEVFDFVRRYFFQPVPKAVDNESQPKVDVKPSGNSSTL